MENMKQRYLYSNQKGKIYAFKNQYEFDLAILEYPDDVEISETEAYLKIFEVIAKSMEKRFANYKNLDIMQEVYYMMLKRYRLKGLFAPDKPFADNVRIWWNYAKKSCLYIIRSFTDKHLDNMDIWDIADNETDTSLCLGKCDNYEIGEHSGVVADIHSTLEKLSHSANYTDQQLGIYATCKLNGLSDNDACIILEIGMPRLYEIRRQLKEYLNLRFGRLI